MHVVYNSFHGRFSDSPRALWERLRERPGWRHTWLQDPAHAAAFPADAETVPIDGPDAAAVLESADLVVAGTHTEVEWTKPAGTTYLQTWHGTPLKRIHYDVLYAPPGRLDRLDEDVARWDALLSPNAFSTGKLRQAFGYGGPIWETGYPRNDLLLSEDAGLVRAKVRADLGVPDDAVAVMYAPTWRDQEKYAGRQVPLPLAAAELLDRLNDGASRQHVLLTRLHYMMTGLSEPDRVPGVVDVSYFPDVRELHLAADVLVTDYSSLMFDFALTGKPMVFYAYDLDRFRDEVRGFYFDLLPQAPGPVVGTLPALAEAVLRRDEDAEVYAERYARFRATYGHREDGHATDRVLERLGLL